MDLYERVSWAAPDKKLAARVVELLYSEGDSQLRYKINRLGGRSKQQKWILQAELFNDIHRWVAAQRKIEVTAAQVRRRYEIVRDFLKAAEKVSLKVGAGYAQAVQLIPEFDANWKKGMGTEVNGMVNYNIMKGLDFGLYAAYLWTGDFLKYPAGLPLTNGSTSATVNTSRLVNSVDNLYDLHFRLNYAF